TQVAEALGQAALILGDAGVVARQPREDRLGLLKSRYGIGFRADQLGDRSHAEVGPGQLGLEGGVGAALRDEALVILQRSLQQLLAQRLHALRIQQLVLADLGEVVVDGLAGLPEILLGELGLLLGDRRLGGRVGTRLLGALGLVL